MEFAILANQIVQSCATGMPAAPEPVHNFEEMLRFFDAAAAAPPPPPAPAAPAAAPAPAVPAVPDQEAEAAAAAAKAAEDAQAAAKAATEAAAAKAAEDAEAARLATEAAAAKAAQDAEAARLATEAAAEAAAKAAEEEEAARAAAAKAATDEAAAATAARDAADAAAAAAAAANFKTLLQHTALPAVGDSIDTSFIAEMEKRPAPDAAPKGAAGKGEIDNLFESDDDDAGAQAAPPITDSDGMPEDLKQMYASVLAHAAKRMRVNLNRSKANAEADKIARANALDEFGRREQAGDFTAMTDAERSVARVRMVLIEEERARRARDREELMLEKEKMARKDRKNGKGAAAAGGRGAPKPSGRSAITKAFRKDLKDGEKSFTDDSTIIPKAVMRRLVVSEFESLGKPHLRMTKDTIEVLRLACVTNLGSFIDVANLSVIDFKRKTLMPKDFHHVVKIASDPVAHLVAKDMYHDGVRKINEAKRNRLPDA